MSEKIFRRNRGYLPHWEKPGASYFVTYRLAGVLPRELVRRWQFEKQTILDNAKTQGRSLTKHERWQLTQGYLSKIDTYLDQQESSVDLAAEPIASLLVRTLNFFHKSRYLLQAWTIMPTHLHTVVKPLPEYSLSKILHSWKSYQANRINCLLGRTGELWQREYFDHWIRDDEEWAILVRYTLENPVRAGLCRQPADWPWSGRRRNAGF